MTRFLSKRSSKMKTDTEIRKTIAEVLRLAIKEFGWGIAHIANIYDMLRTEDSEQTEDPNQLDLFAENTDIVGNVEK